MKAKEYAERYAVLSQWETVDRAVFNKEIGKLYVDLLREFRDILETRHVSSWPAIEAVKKEFNVKANRIVELLKVPVKQDWFLILLSEDEKRFYATKEP